MGKRTPNPEQRRLVAAWRSSSTSKTAFARAHGIQPATFASWVARHETSVPRDEPGHFVALSVAAPVETAGPLVVHVGDHELRFPSPPPPAWFAAMLRELAPC